MSKQDQSLENQKIISLKKIQVEQRVDIEANDVDIIPEDTKETVQSEIDALQKELSTLTLEKEQMLTELDDYIVSEKEKMEQEKVIQLEQAREDGYAAGYVKGEQKAHEIYTTYLERATNIVKKSEEEYIKTIEQHTNAVVRLAIAVAEKIIDQEVTNEKELFLQLVQKALEQLKDTSTISIYVHPTQYDYLHAQKEELEQMLADDEMLYLYADQHLQNYDCIIRHPFGQIDASVDTQLKQIKKALEEKVMEN